MILNYPDDSLESRGYFLANLLHFGRLLRKLDIPVSSQQIYDLAEGVEYINIASRDDFYNAARAFLLHNIDKLGKFNLAFDLFWSKHIRVLVALSGGRKELDQAFVPESLEEQGTKPSELSAMKSKQRCCSSGRFKADPGERACGLILSGEVCADLSGFCGRAVPAR